MLNCRASKAVFVIVAVFALLSPAVPATAEPRSPTPAELAAAQQRIRDARASVGSLMSRAQRAAEAYQGASVRAQKAGLAREIAVNDARQAQSRFIDAHLVATVAQNQSVAASAAAVAAAAASAAADLEARSNRRQLNLIAAGAYRTGGQVGMLSQLMLADDPLELANLGTLMNHIGDHQQRVIDDTKLAHKRSVVAEAKAAESKHTAAAAAAKATRVLAVVAAARSEAQRTSRAATASAVTAEQLLSKANRARASAQLLVTAAERELGQAVLSATALRRAAERARSEASTTRRTPAPNDAAATAIHWAFEQIGVPYSWGGGDESGPTRGFAHGANTVGFDCSGLTLFIYAKAGVRLDHYSQSQWDRGPRVSSRADLKPGDLMFFAFDTNDPSTIHHVSIYIGNGKMIEAPHTGAVVRVASVERSGYIGATRPWSSS